VLVLSRRTGSRVVNTHTACRQHRVDTRQNSTPMQGHVGGAACNLGQEAGSSNDPDTN